MAQVWQGEAVEWDPTHGSEERLLVVAASILFSGRRKLF